MTPAYSAHWLRTVALLLIASSSAAQSWQRTFEGSCAPQLITPGEGLGALLGGPSDDWPPDVCLVQLDADGGVRWQVEVGTPGFDRLQAFDADPGSDGACLLLESSSVVALGGEGALRWARRVITAGYEKDVAATKEGGCVVVGTACLPDMPAFVTAFDREGRERWSRTLLGAGDVIHAFHRVVTLADDSVIVAGLVHDHDAWQQGHLVVVRLSEDGVVEWVRELAPVGSRNGTVTALAASRDGSIAAATRVRWPCAGGTCDLHQIIGLTGRGDGVWTRSLLVSPDAPAGSLPARVVDLAFTWDGELVASFADETSSTPLTWRLASGQFLGGIARPGVLSGAALPDGTMFELWPAEHRWQSFRAGRRDPRDPLGACVGGWEVTTSSLPEPISLGEMALGDPGVPPIIDDEPDIVVRPGASRARSECPPSAVIEPSALDLRPGVTPLLVTKGSSGSLRLTWEDVAADAYRVHANFLTSIRGSVTWESACDHSLPETSLVPLRGSHFYVVSAIVGATESSHGRTSFGVERPPQPAACP